MNFNNLIKHPRVYYKKMLYFLYGKYFDIFLKKYKTDSCVFEIPKQLTDVGGRGYFARDEYEWHERRIIKQHLNPDSKVLELGACIGVVSCITNKILRNPKFHLVVEANPELIPYLESNRIRNKCGFYIVNAAISNKATLDFYSGNNMVSGGIIKKGNSRESYEIRGIKLDDIEKYCQTRFDTLILDIEGGEYQFFTENQLFLKQLKNIFIEIHPHIIGIEKTNQLKSLFLLENFRLVDQLGETQFWGKITGLA